MIENLQAQLNSVWVPNGAEAMQQRTGSEAVLGTRTYLDRRQWIGLAENLTTSRVEAG